MTTVLCSANMLAVFATSVFLCLAAVCPVCAFPAFLSDDQSLNLPATGGIHFERVRSLGLNRGAHEDLLSVPIMFPKLDQIGLRSEKNNSKYISDLVQYYPNIRSLSLMQNAPVSDSSMEQLASLRNLRKLSLSCPIASPRRLSDISDRVVELSVYENNNILNTSSPVPLKFPKLEKLDIRGQTIDETFFSNLYAPRLRRIFLGNVVLSPQSLNGLSNFAKLRDIEMYRTPVEKSQVALLSARHKQSQVRKSDE